MELSAVEGTGQNAPAERSLGGDSAYDLGTGEYMDLYLEQLKNQDPENPMKTQEMMNNTNQLIQLQNNNQMTQKIEEMSTAADGLMSSIEEMTGSAMNSQYISKIGDNVKIETTEGKTHSGQLDKVKVNENSEIVIDGESFSTGDIESIGVT